MRSTTTRGTLARAQALAKKQRSMKMKWFSMFLATMVVALAVGITVASAGNEEEIALSKVPKKVLEAARKAVPGIKLTEAEVEKTSDGLVYELEGTKDGKEYEIKVSAAGKVLKVEIEDDDDDDEDDDD